jgi:predicted aspartyl protease
MIRGEFDDQGKLFFPIDLVTADGETIPVDAMLDTGFTDFLALNKQDIEDLGWSLLSENHPMQTAQGEALFNLYDGTVIIDGQEFNIPVLGGDAIAEIIFGLPWLQTRRLVVDFPAGVLTLG